MITFTSITYHERWDENTIPSPVLAEFVVNAFANLDAVEEKISAFPQIQTMEAAEFLLFGKI